MNQHSSNTWQVVLQIAGYAVFTVIAIWSARHALRNKRRRQADLNLLALRFGPSFKPDKDERFPMGWGFLTKLAQGTNRYASNLMQGFLGEYRVFVFDYHYQAGSGKKEKAHDGTCLMLIVPEAFSSVVIEPKTFSSAVADALGFGDIHFESAEFSKTYRVSSPDKKFAYDVCNPQMMTYLLENPKLVLEINGPAILLVFENRLAATEIEPNLHRLLEIRSHLPDYLFTTT